MDNFKCFKNKNWRYYLKKSENGFSLIELLLALLILMLIVFAFTPLLVGSIERVHFAGDKTEALYQGQSDLEVDIAERNTVDGLELTFTFGDTVIHVPGGLVEAEITKGRATAWLSGFVPFVPSINLYLAPLPLVEGYDPTTIIVMGKNTDFSRAKSQNEKFQFYDSGGTEVANHSYAFNIIIEPPSDIPSGYDEYAGFELGAGLTNDGSIYRLVLKWTIENNIEVTVRSRLQVVLPYAVAVGTGQKVWISPDARETWKFKSQVPGSGNLHDITWTGFEYFAVTNSGRIITWRDSESISNTPENYGTLNGVAYGGGKYIVVGNGGSIYSSGNAINWNNVSSSNSDLQAVHWGGNEFMTVGNSGTILSSVDGISWIDESPTYTDSDGVVKKFDDITFKGIAYGAQWLAVGSYSSGNAVIFSKSGEIWNENEVLSLPGLNDIIHDGSRYIAVGNEGTLITSKDGTNWTKLSLTTNNNLNALDWGDIADDTNHYIIVGDSGTILTWTGDLEHSWILETSGITDSIYSVAVRWAN